MIALHGYLNWERYWSGNIHIFKSVQTIQFDANLDGIGLYYIWSWSKRNHDSNRKLPQEDVFQFNEVGYQNLAKYQDMIINNTNQMPTVVESSNMQDYQLTHEDPIQHNITPSFYIIQYVTESENIWKNIMIEHC